MIYEKAFYHYTVKQWGLLPEDLDPSVAARVPIHLSRDNCYFQDFFLAMPEADYTALFKRLLDHPAIEMRLGKRFQDIDGTEGFDRSSTPDRSTNSSTTCTVDRHIAASASNITTASERPVQIATVENAADAAKLGTVSFAGRLGDYSYYNIEQAVGRAPVCFENEISCGGRR